MASFRVLVTVFAVLAFATVVSGNCKKNGCPSGEFCNSPSCKPCTNCTLGTTFMSNNGCTGSVDRTCGACTTCNATSYVASECTLLADTDCRDCSALNADCTACSDANTCTACTGTLIASGSDCVAPSACQMIDAQCTTCAGTTCSACASGFFLTGNTCTACGAACTAGTFESTACGGSTNRGCTTCTTCNTGEIQFASCTATSNAQCAVIVTVKLNTALATDDLPLAALASALNIAQNTITVIGSSLTRSARSVRAGCFDTNPVGRTAQVYFMDSSAPARLAALVAAGDASVSNAGLCIASTAGNGANAVSPVSLLSTSPAPAASTTPAAAAPPAAAATSTDTPVPEAVNIGVGVGIGVGVPLLILLIILLWCCCCRRKTPAKAATPAAATKATPAAAAASEGTYTYDSASGSYYTEGTYDGADGASYGAPYGDEASGEASYGESYGTGDYTEEI